MTILFFDTETTGLVVDGAPWESQPHLVQLACILTDDDGLEHASLSCIVSPEGAYTIPANVAHIHGIDTVKAEAVGVSLHCATRTFIELGRRANLLVAHNMKFDNVVMSAARHRTFPNIPPLATSTHCTMEASAPILRLPPTPAMVRAGRGPFKPPRLAEAYAYFGFGELVGAHDALVDVRACAKIYFEIKRRTDAQP